MSIRYLRTELLSQIYIHIIHYRAEFLPGEQIPWIPLAGTNKSHIL